jgi:hypothetical protein
MTFDEWWDKEIDDSLNPYRKDSPIYWAFGGWQARASEVNHWKELAEYRLALLTKMPEDSPWVGLTDDEALDVWGKSPLGETEEQGALLLCKAIEAKLREKNGG